MQGKLTIIIFFFHGTKSALNYQSAIVPPQQYPETMQFAPYLGGHNGKVVKIENIFEKEGVILFGKGILGGHLLVFRTILRIFSQ